MSHNSKQLIYLQKRLAWSPVLSKFSATFHNCLFLFWTLEQDVLVYRSSVELVWSGQYSTKHESVHFFCKINDIKTEFFFYWFNTIVFLMILFLCILQVGHRLFSKLKWQIFWYPNFGNTVLVDVVHLLFQLNCKRSLARLGDVAPFICGSCTSNFIARNL